MRQSSFIRNTHQRQIILLSLRNRFDHPSADMVYTDVREKIPRISLSTVYRNLETLHGMGLVLKIDAGDGPAHYDGNPQPHYHAICQGCSRIIDVPDEAVTSFGYNTAKIPDFEITGHAVHFFGRCDECRKNVSPDSPL